MLTLLNVERELRIAERAVFTTGAASYGSAV